MDGLVRATLALLVTGFFLWLGIAWSGYAERFAQAGDNWSKGTKHQVELTLIREDKTNLACSSDARFGDLHCMYRGDKKPADGPQDGSLVLQPYNTVKNEPLLAAGLWNTPTLTANLPSHRFTVVCQFEVTGVVRTVGLRWSTGGPFEPSKQSLAVGTLKACEIPQ